MYVFPFSQKQERRDFACRSYLLSVYVYLNFEAFAVNALIGFGLNDDVKLAVVRHFIFKSAAFRLTYHIKIRCGFIISDLVNIVVPYVGHIARYIQQQFAVFISAGNVFDF